MQAIHSKLRILALVALTACCGGRTGPPADPETFHQGKIQFPGSHWSVVDDPQAFGWSAGALAEARAAWEKLDSAALMVVHRGAPIAAWGEVAARYNGQSIRKSLLAALIGLEVEAGRLRLDATLAELGVDERPPGLTPDERRATVRDLLLSRSGIYHSALYEAGTWKRNKPERGSHLPGAAWYYNNWDFNALGTIFEAAAGVPIHTAFGERIAAPLEMEDFRPRDVKYLTRSSPTERIMGNASAHRAYVFMNSARDLARFGLLYLAGGRWRESQVLPAEWVRESLEGVAVGEPAARWLGPGTRYGYLWWVYPPGHRETAGAEGPAWVARGARGHRIIVLPAHELVIVHSVATGGVGLLPQLKRRFVGAHEVSDEEIRQLVGRILQAHPGPRAQPAGGAGSPTSSSMP